MTKLSPLMRRSVAVAAGTQLLPGTRVAWVDAEAPLPKSRRLKATVTWLHLCFDGKSIELDAVGIVWDRGPGVREDVLQKDELGQLEIIK